MECNRNNNYSGVLVDNYSGENLEEREKESARERGVERVLHVTRGLRAVTS